MYTEEQVIEAANGILDVMGGADGGAQFTRFWHGTLVAIIANLDNEEVQILAELIVKFNRLVQINDEQLLQSTGGDPQQR